MKQHLLIFGLVFSFLLLVGAQHLSSSKKIAFPIQAKGVFTHGIASGDPAQNSIVLWTRFLSTDSSATTLTFELSKDENFTTLSSSGKVQAARDNDFCAKVIAEGLEAGTSYFYRFSDGRNYSPIGKTKTLPEKTEHIKIGVVNCSKYTGGYYHAYEALSKMEDIDVVIHLGDYIYESGATKPTSSYYPAFLKTGRQHNPPHECITLKDYRTRYAQYRADSSLQKLHANFPMIPIWDDHEIAMKKEPKKDNTTAYKAWEDRRDQSIIAYHEWLPLRPAPFSKIYRSFQFGDLVNLLMLDTRVCCKSAVSKTEASLKDTSRHIVGNEQLQWIFDEIQQHDAHWNVFGNQLLLAEKGKGWARWQGFPRDRDRFLQFVEDRPEQNVVFTTGNAHNPHHYIVLNESKSDTLVHEFLPGSISSGNNSEKAFYDPVIIAKEDKRLREAENVLWFHQDSHGFIVLDITPEQLEARWFFVSTIREQDYEMLQPYTVKLKSKRR